MDAAMSAQPLSPRPDDGLRAEIEALPKQHAVVNMDDPREWWIDVVSRAAVLEIVDRLAATLPAAALSSPETTPAGVLALDAERLAKAMTGAAIRQWLGTPAGVSPNTARVLANDLAAEYNRLGGAPKEDWQCETVGCYLHAGHASEHEPGMCECGADMEAHSGGWTLLHHDQFMEGLRGAPAGVLDEAALREAAQAISDEVKASDAQGMGGGMVNVWLNWDSVFALRTALSSLGTTPADPDAGPAIDLERLSDAIWNTISVKPHENHGTGECSHCDTWRAINRTVVDESVDEIAAEYDRLALPLGRSGSDR